MLPGRIPYRFSAIPWKYSAKAAWYFVALPAELSAEIRALFQHMEEGWGRLPVQAAIAEHTWKTAIWFDRKQNTYLLPLKSEIRRKLAFDPEKEYDIFLYL